MKPDAEKEANLLALIESAELLIHGDKGRVEQLARTLKNTLDDLTCHVDTVVIDQLFNSWRNLKI